MKVEEILAQVVERVDQVRQVINRISSDYFLPPGRTEDGIDRSIVSLSDPNCLISEQYKSICTKLFWTPEGKQDYKTLLFTSAQPGDGKTTTACNVAATLAQNFRQKVLLIDADLRRPAVHNYFGLPRSPGLSDILRGTIDHVSFIQSPAVRDLYVIPAGSATNNPSHLLNSLALKVLLEKLKSEFDVVIFDTSPVLKAADAQVLGGHCDAVLFVIKANSTPKHMVDDSLALLKDTSAMPKATIMTNTSRAIDYYSYWTNADYRQYYWYRYESEDSPPPRVGG